jgi:hypothetical protein
MGKYLSQVQIPAACQSANLPRAFRSKENKGKWVKQTLSWIFFYYISFLSEHLTRLDLPKNSVVEPRLLKTICNAFTFWQKKLFGDF